MRHARLWVLLSLMLTAITIPRGVSVAENRCAYTPQQAAAMLAAFDHLAKSGMVQPADPTLEVDPPPNALFASFTRAAFSAVLVKALKRDHEAQQMQGQAPFSDLRDHSLAGHVAVLKEEGIVRGYPDGQFRPNAVITLSEAKLMLARTLRLGTSLTLDSADAALGSGGVDPAVPCSDEPLAARGQIFLLLDRAMKTSLYDRSGR